MIRGTGSILKSNQARRRGNHRPGFTLVEMIVATMLLVIGVAAAQTAISSATRVSGIADKINTATLLLQKKCAELDLNPGGVSGGDDAGDFGVDYPEFRWHQSAEATNYTNLFKVTITVQWGDGTSGSSRNITTYIRSDQATINQNIITPPVTTTTTGTATTGAK